jgi:hypothetical protein
MEAAISSIRSELEEALTRWVEDVLASVDQRTQGLQEELNAKMEETQLELQMSLDTWTRSLCNETADTRSLTSGCKEHS